MSQPHDARDQPFSGHFSSLRSTALNHTDKSSSLWLIFFFLHFFFFHMDVTMKWMSSCVCFCSVINAVLIKLSWGRSESKSQRETPRPLGVFSRTSTPPAPWFGSRRFLRGNSYWRCSRGCCDPSINSHPPTDQSDHCRKKRHAC